MPKIHNFFAKATAPAPTIHQATVGPGNGKSKRRAVHLSFTADAIECYNFFRNFGIHLGNVGSQQFGGR